MLFIQVKKAKQIRWTFIVTPLAFKHSWVFFAPLPLCSHWKKVPCDSVMSVFLLKQINQGSFK